MNQRNKVLGAEVLAHWRRLRECKTMLDVEDEGTGVSECAFCGEYNPYNGGICSDDDCVGCPVYKRTGFQYCMQTPYIMLSAAKSRLTLSDPAPTKEIQAELDFLTDIIEGDE